MSSIPVGSQVLSRFGQAGIVVHPDSRLWPTLTAVKWVGTHFLTYEDSHKLELVALPEGEPRVAVKSHHVGGFGTDPKLLMKAHNDHAAMLARARQRAGVSA